MPAHRTYRLATAALAAAAVVVPADFASASHAATTPLKRGDYINHTRVRDGYLYVHPVSVDRSGGVRWAGGGYTYNTLLPHHTKASETPLASHGFDGDPPTLQAVTTTVSGRAIDVVTADCAALQVFRVSRAVTTLPTIRPDETVASTHTKCLTQNLGGVPGAVGLAKGRVAVLLTTRQPKRLTSQVRVLIGKPGHHFTTQTVAKFSGDETGAAIARDPANGALYVAVGKSPGQVEVWHSRTSHQKFGQPVVLPTAPGTSYLGAIAASHGYVWVGADLEGSDGTYTAQLSRRSPGSGWTSFSPVMRPPALTGDISLSASPHSKHPSVWEGNSVLTANSSPYPKPDGIDVRHLTGKRIGPAQHYSTAKYNRLLSIAARWTTRVDVASDSYPPRGDD